MATHAPALNPESLDDAYERELRALLQRDQDAFVQVLRARWEGKGGPDLFGYSSWDDILIEIILESPEEERALWFEPLAHVLRDLQEKVPGAITPPERLHLLGALVLLHYLPWNRESPAKGGMGDILDSWLNRAATQEGYGRFISYNYLEQEQFFGQNEVDVLVALLHLAAVQRPFGSVSKKIWALAMRQAERESTPENSVLAARRVWEIALWSGKKNHPWLATNLWPLSQTLNKAEGVAGNLTRLFYLLDWRHGKESVQKMILLVRADNVPDPDRASFSKMLDYYGDEAPDAIRSHLYRIGNDRGLSYKENAMNLIRNFLTPAKDLVPCAP